jgi:uncharacterized membrane protein YkoI
MKHITATLIALGALTGWLICSAADQDEKPLKLTDLPAAAQKAIQQHATADQITELTQEDEDGKVVYDVEFTKAGQHNELTVTAAGKIVSMEEQVAEKDVPDAVRKTIAQQSAGGKVEVIEKVIEDGKTHYEITVSKAGQKVETEIAADGKIVETQETTGKKD